MGFVSFFFELVRVGERFSFVRVGVWFVEGWGREMCWRGEGLVLFYMVIVCLVWDGCSRVCVKVGVGGEVNLF